MDYYKQTSIMAILHKTHLLTLYKITILHKNVQF